MTATHLYNSWIEKLRHMRAGENKARLRTIAWMIVGMIMSRSVHLSYIAQKIPSVGQQTSIAKRLSRWLNNGALRVRDWYSPLARDLLGDIVANGQSVRLMIDGTKVGGGHRLLMVAVAYRRRSLPIAWTWLKGQRGHSLATTQCALFAYIRTLLPEGASVLVVGDSEFGSVELMRHLNQWGWDYVFCAKKHPEGSRPASLPKSLKCGNAVMAWCNSRVNRPGWSMFSLPNALPFPSTSWLTGILAKIIPGS